MSKVQHYPLLFENNSYQWKVHYFLSNNGLYSIILCIQSIKLKIFLQAISMVAFLPPHGLAMMTLDNPHPLALKTNIHYFYKLIIIIISIIIKPISSLIKFYNFEKQHTCNVIRSYSHALYLTRPRSRERDTPNAHTSNVIMSLCHYVIIS